MDTFDLFHRKRVTGGDFTQTITSDQFNSAGVFQFSSTSSTVTLRNYSSIEDNPHRHSKRFASGYPPSALRHKKIVCDNLKPITGKIETDTSGTYKSNWRSSVGYAFFPYVHVSDVNSLLPSISDTTYFSLNREAFNYFADAFPAQMSFSEFIVGMRDLRALMPQLQESMAKSFSGGYLNKKFGWDNLLSDLNTLSLMMANVRSRLNYLKRTYGLPSRLGFVRPVFQTTGPQIGASIRVNGPDSHWWTTLTLENVFVVYRAGVTILQTLDYIDGFAGIIRELIGALGLNNPVKAVWVNLPFSFIVDWFFHISDHLDTLTRLNPATGWNMSNITNSVKIEADISVRFHHTRSGDNLENFTRDVGTIQSTQYRRHVGLPLSLSDLLPISELSPTQLTLLLALLHQQA